MLIDNEHFSKIFNSKIFENSKIELLSKITDYPERYIGIFRPTKPKMKIIQNITQSHEIRFGDAMEIIIAEYFEKSGYNALNKRLICADCELNIDQYFEKDNNIYFIEQKVRDDHDSTKKRGQIDNFEKKLIEVIERNKDKKINAYFYFIDPSLSKNKNYYKNELLKLEEDYGVNCYLFYGQELFEHFNHQNIWDELISNLKTWRDNLPDFPEINFDLNPNESFDEIKKLSISKWRKLLNNSAIIEDVFSVIFPTKATLNLLKTHFDILFKENPNQIIYNNLSKKLNDIIH